MVVGGCVRLPEDCDRRTCVSATTKQFQILSTDEEYLILAFSHDQKVQTRIRFTCRTSKILWTMMMVQFGKRDPNA
jgi:hypothetical protein